MKYPLISIAIATLNSERTLPFVLKSIRKQTYPNKRIEIIIVDGGSTDGTCSIAKRFHCKVVLNPKVDLVFGKHIGYKSAKGEFLLFLDSDEVLENPDSIKNKYLAIISSPKVKAVISSGYKKPRAYPDINFYINEYGDPFSLFMYRSSRDGDWFLKELIAKYRKIGQSRREVVFDFGALSTPPFIELISMGVMIDLKYVKKTFPKILVDPALHIHLFYLLISKGNLFAVMKNDFIIHYSAATLRNYFKKIKSRVKNNIYMTEMGSGGFSGREKFFPTWYKVKKILFIPYSLSVILPAIDGFGLCLSRKKSIYLIHPVLCLYTLLLIVWYYILKKTGIKIRHSGYGV